MAPDSSHDDRITSAILSDSTYERLRYERHAFLGQPVHKTLLLQSAALGLLALPLPMYGLFPASAASYLPAADPAAASPKVLLLGVFGGAMELLGAGLLVVAAAYRVHRAPLSEAQAHAALDAEEFARGIGLVTGGLAILLAVCLFAVGLGGEAAIASYVATMGANPFAPSGFGLSISTVSIWGFAASVLVFYAGSYTQVRVLLERLRNR